MRELLDALEKEIEELDSYAARSCKAAMECRQRIKRLIERLRECDSREGDS